MEWENKIYIPILDETAKKASENLSPYNLYTLLFSQIRIGLWKWSRPKKTTMSRKRTRMRTLYDMMSTGIDERLFGYCGIAPKDKYDTYSFSRECSDNSISQVFPTHMLVARRFSFSDSQYGIHEENSLLCPVSEICLCSLDSYIGFEFLENIAETRLCSGSIWHREWESHGSTSCMIRILPEDHNTYLIKRSCIKSSEDIFPLWKTYFLRIFAFYKICEFFPIWLLELECEYSMPRWMYIDCHILKYSNRGGEINFIFIYV